MMNACRILPEAGATGKSTRSFRLPPTLRRGASPGDGSPPPIDNAAGATCPAAAALAGLSWNG